MSLVSDTLSFVSPYSAFGSCIHESFSFIKIIFLYIDLFTKYRHIISRYCHTSSAKPNIVLKMGSTLQAVLVVSLAFQNAGSGLLMRYVRSTPEENQFDTEMAVISQELVKIIVCSMLILLTGE